MPIRPPNTRLGRREPDLQLIQGTPAAIADLIKTLDRRLEDEQRPSERLRMLREATNQITRTANDAIQAYRRTRAAVTAELAMPTGDWKHAKRMSAELTVARQGVLTALEETSRRYPTVAEEAPALAIDAATLAAESVSS